MKDLISQLLLEMRYVNGKPQDVVTMKLGFDRGWIFRFHGNDLREIEGKVKYASKSSSLPVLYYKVSGHGKFRNTRFCLRVENWRYQVRFKHVYKEVILVKNKVSLALIMGWSGVLLVILSLTASGCAPTNARGSAKDLVAEPTHLLRLIDAWEERGGKELTFSKITISESHQNSDLVVKFVADTNISVERYWELRPVIMGVARKDTGAIAELSVFGNAHGPAVTAEKIEFLIPYAKVAVGIMDPSLSDEECDDILNQLGLSVDNLDGLEEVRTSSNPRPELVQNGIEYRIGFTGSEEGGTVKLQATLQM